MFGNAAASSSLSFFRIGGLVSRWTVSAERVEAASFQLQHLWVKWDLGQLPVVSEPACTRSWASCCNRCVVFSSSGRSLFKIPWNTVSLFSSEDFNERISSIWSIHPCRPLFEKRRGIAKAYSFHAKVRVHTRYEHYLKFNWNRVQKRTQPCDMCHQPRNLEKHSQTVEKP